MWGGGVGHTGGGAGDSLVNGENNRCYSYLSLDFRMMPIGVGVEWVM